MLVPQTNPVKAFFCSKKFTYIVQGAKKVIFTACYLGKLRLAYTSPNVISTSLKIFLMSTIDVTVLL